MEGEVIVKYVHIEPFGTIYVLDPERVKLHNSESVISTVAPYKLGAGRGCLLGVNVPDMFPTAPNIDAAPI